MEFELRRGEVGEEAAIAELHVKVWRATYRTLAPDQAIERMDEAFRRPGWRAALEDEDRCVFVAALQQRIIGVIGAGLPSEAAFGTRGEIRGLYVDPQFAGRGLGRRLMRMSAEWMLAEGFSGCALGVVRGNDSALAFYLRIGGRIAGQYRDVGPVWRSENVLVVWDDLAGLAGR